jgi:serine/threonine protein kinase
MLESGERKAATTLVGSLPWMGPEVLVHGKDRKYSTAVDIWSLGMTAIELAMGEAPYEKIAHEAMRVRASSLLEAGSRLTSGR